MNEPGGPPNPFAPHPGAPPPASGNNPYGPPPGSGPASGQNPYGPPPGGGASSGQNPYGPPPGQSYGPPGPSGPYGPPGAGSPHPYGPPGQPGQPGQYGGYQPHHVPPPQPGQNHLPPGFVSGGHAPPPRKKGKSPWLIIGIVLFSSCVVCGGFGAYLNAQDEKKRADPKEKVSAGEMIDLYDDNELAANDRWKDEWVQINGYVQTIGSDVFDDPYVTISSGGFTFINVQCEFEDEHKDELHDLGTGDPITVVGKVDGMILNIMVKKCEVVDDD